MEGLSNEPQLWPSNFETRALGFGTELTPPSRGIINSSNDAQYYESDRTGAAEGQARPGHEKSNEALIGTDTDPDGEDEPAEEIQTLRGPELSTKSYSEDRIIVNIKAAKRGDGYPSAILAQELDPRSEGRGQSSDISNEDVGSEGVYPRGSRSPSRGVSPAVLLTKTPGRFYRTGTKLSSNPFEVLKSRSITISDDLSHDAKLEERQYHALRARGEDSLSNCGKFPGPSFTFERTTNMAPPPDSDLQIGLAKKIEQPANESYSSKRTLSEYTSNIELGNEILSLGLVELQSYITRLEQRAKDLSTPSSNPGQTYSYRTLYRISDYVRGPAQSISRRVVSSPFFDPPEWVGSGHDGVLRCRVPVANLDLFLERNKDLSFLVYKTYVIPETQHRSASQPEDAAKFRINESITPITDNLKEGLRTLMESRYEYSEIWKDYQDTKELKAPYLFVYHQRADWGRLHGSVKQSSQEQLVMLWDYIVRSHGDEYAAADNLISNGKITPRYTQYLFKPGDVLIEHDGDFHLGWVAKAWAQHLGTLSATPGERVRSKSWSINGWHWEFDGNFQRKSKLLEFSIREDISADDGIPIRDLRVYPIQYAPSEIIQRLRKRGKTFWKCRLRGFVSYKDEQENMAEERYIIDLRAYRSLHKNNQDEKGFRGTGLADELGPGVVKKDEPPDDEFELLLPPTIKGFNMHRKKWYDLVADRISDVNWNKEAFQKIVMNRKAKDLIQALVSSHLAAETNMQSADLIEGKGNGLILLLHGSPGTGKTLTAESVAEIAEKPLYRVTCADIGTKAEDAEKYLESVLHLGKLWKCVVLLDEADVFLEQRSLEDLQRNALVSVFLRVLEYYEGILILTSNRVGTFDDAFKSRIQLALHYPALGPYERLQIWQNFFERLDSSRDAAIDVDDLRDHLDELKEEEMNGRQIRNAITTARQYAKWKGETLTYSKLKDVIEVAGRFDKYLNKLHRGLTQDQLAEDEGLRLR